MTAIEPMDDTTQQAAIPQGQQPTLAEIINHLPEAGQVYFNVALARWQNAQQQQVLAQQQQHIVALQSALLSAGIDPNTLQPTTAETPPNGTSGGDD